MTDNPTIREQWQAYAKEACAWCAAGCDGSFMRDGKHYAQLVNNEPFGGPAAPCTAMTFEAWCAWRIERLTDALRSNREGYLNILEVRKLASGRYGALTREEVEQVIAEIDGALVAQPESGVTTPEPPK